MNMQSRIRSAPPKAARGSALIVVMMLCVLLMVVLGSFLRSSGTQSRTGYRDVLRGEARNAAEGAAEYALAEMTSRAESQPSFGVTGDPLSGWTLPAADVSFLAPGTGNNHVVSTSVAFKNSVFSDRPTAPMLIDSADPVNANGADPDVTKWVSVRSVNVFAKATVTDPAGGGTATSYVSQNVQVREQAWFNYAIFFNMDMEFHAGPNMDVLGPVHTNENAYITQGTGGTLNFLATLTAVKRILRADKYNLPTIAPASNHVGAVQFITAAGMNPGDLVAMTTTQDSTDTSFRTSAENTWNKFVQDQTFNVKAFKPPGLPAYVPEDFSTGAVELRNNAYLILEPQLSTVSTDGDYGQKAIDAENLKFSALSGFIIQVSAPGGAGQPPKWKLVVYQRSDTSDILSSSNHPARNTTNGKPIAAVTIDPFDTTTNIDEIDAPGASSTWTLKRALRVALLDAIVSIPYRETGSGSAGNRALRSWTPAAPATDPSTFTPALTYYPIYDRREGYIHPSGTTNDGLKGAMNVLRIDLKKLNALINNVGIWLNPDPLRATTKVYDVAANYTGVVYVQFPLANIDLTRFPTPVGSGPAPAVTDPAYATTYPDRIRKAQGATTTTPGYAVVLANGGNATDGSTVPQLAGGPDGFTLATNAPAYVLGHFNADGVSTTGSSTTPDSSAERTAMIAADTVTVLTPGFDFQNCATNKTTGSGFTEISAAIITGLIPTHPGSADIWAGGVHNFIHYLENWNDTYCYRGSLAALFESEVATGAYHEGFQGYWYDPPTRAIGYHQYLSQGRFPPGTPIVRTVRRMDMQDITAAVYATGPLKPIQAN